MGLSSVSNFQSENLFTINSEEELTAAFRPRDQKKLVLPANFKFPMRVQSYLTWRESSGTYTYLVYKAQNWDMAKGVAFKHTHSNGEQTGGLCSWCNAYGSSEDIGLMSITVDPKETRAYYICQDLRCIEKIEEATTLSGKGPEKYIAELYYRIERMFENLSIR